MALVKTREYGLSITFVHDEPNNNFELLREKMKLFKKIIELFYHRKYKDGKCYTRILFFRYSKPGIELIVPDMRHVGRYTYVGQQNLYIANQETVIGSFCSLGQHVWLGHGEHPLHFLSTSPYFYFDELGFKAEKSPSHAEFWYLPPIHIGNDVWIGDGVFVKNGVTIGDGAVLGARSVVTKDVPPYAIVAGVPAKIIRYRFDEPTRQELLRLKWWELDDDIIRQIPYDNISATLQFLREVRGK